MNLPSDIFYLACPYSDSDPGIVEWRFEECSRLAGILIEHGVQVYSQISMIHPILQGYRNRGFTPPTGFWTSLDESFMSVCRGLILIDLAGWENSGGVRHEIEYFRSVQRPVITIGEFARERGFPL